jgi:hypothetical protein
MGLRIRQRQRGAPRAAKDKPGLQAQMAPKALDVRYEMPGRIILQTRKSRGCRSTAAPLIILNHTPLGKIKRGGWNFAF